MTRSTIPEKEQVEVPEEAVELATRCRYEREAPKTAGPWEKAPANSRLIEALREDVAEDLQAAAPVLCAQERERLLGELRERGSVSEGLEEMVREDERNRLGMEKCPNVDCEEGVVCVTGTERGPEGEAIPVPEQERCPTCGGHGFVSAFTRAAVKAAAQQERERVKEALERLWARAEEEKDKTATAFDERDKMAGDREAADEANLLDDFHRVLEELFPRCDGEGFLGEDEACPGCPECLFNQDGGRA